MKRSGNGSNGTDAKAEEELISIGELASRTGVTTRTIRYYEQLGILPPPERTEGSMRRYPPNYTFLVKAALSLKELGFTLEEIATLAWWNRGEAMTKEQFQQATRLVDEKVAELENKLRLLSKTTEILRKRRRQVSSEIEHGELDFLPELTGDDASTAATASKGKGKGRG